MSNRIGQARDFTDLPPAFAAAAPGDTIYLRSGGPYTSATTSKGVNVVTDPNWRFVGSITVNDLPADQTFASSGLRTVFFLRRCAGKVLIDGVFQGGPLSGHGMFEVIDCAFVSLNNSWVTDMVVRNSTVVMTDSLVDGWVDPWPIGEVAFPALRMTNSDVTASECAFRGGHAAPTAGTWPAVPGIEMQGGRLRLAAEQNTQQGWAQGGHVRLPSGQTILSPAIHSDGGSVIIDPDVVLPRYDGAPFSGTSQLITEEIPFVTLQHLIPGSAIDCSVIEPHNCPILDGPPGASAWILVSLPAPPLASPFGDFWLHPPSTIVVAGGTVAPSGKMLGSIDLRTVLRPGDATTWQGAVLGPNGLQLTHPVVPVMGKY